MKVSPLHFTFPFKLKRKDSTLKELFLLKALRMNLCTVYWIQNVWCRFRCQLATEKKKHCWVFSHTPFISLCDNINWPILRLRMFTAESWGCVWSTSACFSSLWYGILCSRKDDESPFPNILVVFILEPIWYITMLFCIIKAGMRVMICEIWL